jgi:hypothetical protein
MRIHHDPYAEVDWTNDLRLKAQHHDHVVSNLAAIPAYDAAGYDVLALMDYSGAPSAAYAYKERTWPPERFVSPGVLAALVNIKFFIPGAEEVGIETRHLTSPFLTTYIEGMASAGSQSASAASAPTTAATVPAAKYGSLKQLVAAVRDLGGLPCIAHPFNYDFDELDGLLCVEMYSAFAEAAKIDMPGTWLHTRDGNAMLLAAWDHALQRNQRVLGIAVNDHFGPQRRGGRVPNEVLDSGKIVVLAKAATPAAYRNALERGAFFAVRDMGRVKNQFPEVFRISVEETFASIESTGNVTWKTGGNTVSTGSVILYSDLPPDSRYVRAEIAGLDGSVVYTQAFAVRPLRDVDGDFDADDDDAAICRSLDTATERNAVWEAACRAGRYLRGDGL